MAVGSSHHACICAYIAVLRVVSSRDAFAVVFWFVARRVVTRARHVNVNAQLSYFSVDVGICHIVTPFTSRLVMRGARWCAILGLTRCVGVPQYRTFGVITRFVC